MSTSSPSPSPLGRASKTLLKQPAFLAAFAVLLLAAVSLNGATQFLQLHFKKLPVPLAKPLDDIDTSIGSWVCVSKDQLSEDMEQELGTHQYVMRWYVKRSALTQSELDGFKDKDYRARLEYLTNLRRQHHGQLDKDVINFAVTYYTGKADTVAHIPERCYTADGFDSTDASSDTWDIQTPQLPAGKLPVRYISFGDTGMSDATAASAMGQMKRNVAYFFHTNGSYTSDSAIVRLKLQNLRAKYGYYAKVEMMVQSIDRDEAAKSMQDFLRDALPEVEQCLPAWDAAKGMPKDVH